MRILLIAGHGAGDPGACSTYGIEADESRKVVNKMYEEFKNYDVQVDIYNQNRNAFNDVLNGCVPVNFSGYDYVFEVHFNSAGQTAEGTEIYVTYAENGTRTEEIIVNNVASLGFLNRGVKRENFAVINSAKNKGTSSALMEVCFISNNEDMNTYKNKFTDICKAMVQGIAEGFGITRINNPVQEIEIEKIKNIGGVYNMAGTINMRAKYRENGVEIWSRWYNMDIEACDPYKNIIGLEIYTELPLKWGVLVNGKYVTVEGSAVIEGAEIYGFQAYLTDNSRKTYYWVSSSGDKVGYEWWANNCKYENIPAICQNTDGATPLNAINLKLG